MKEWPFLYTKLCYMQRLCTTSRCHLIREACVSRHWLHHFLTNFNRVWGRAISVSPWGSKKVELLIYCLFVRFGQLTYSRGQIRLSNGKTTDLDWYYSKPNQKLKCLICDLLFITFVKPPHTGSSTWHSSQQQHMSLNFPHFTFTDTNSWFGSFHWNCLTSDTSIRFLREAVIHIYRIEVSSCKTQSSQNIRKDKKTTRWRGYWTNRHYSQP